MCGLLCMKRLGIITARHYKATIDLAHFCLSMMKIYAFSTYIHGVPVIHKTRHYTVNLELALFWFTAEKLMAKLLSMLDGYKHLINS